MSRAATPITVSYFLHRLAGGDAPRGDLVAGRHLRAHAQAELGQLLAERDRLARDQHVVVGVQADQR